jgi:hypothetical protein
MDGDISTEDAQAQLNQYGSDDVTEQLLRLGEVIISELIERAGQIDAKAMTALGYGLAGLVFMLVQDERTTSLLLSCVRSLAGAVLFVASVLAYARRLSC